MCFVYVVVKRTLTVAAYKDEKISGILLAFMPRFNLALYNYKPQYQEQYEPQ